MDLSNNNQNSSIHILSEIDASIYETKLSPESGHNNNGWKYAIKHYFPHYTCQETGTVQIEERPSWFHCVAYGIQHVLAMFSGVIVLRK